MKYCTGILRLKFCDLPAFVLRITLREQWMYRNCLMNLYFTRTLNKKVDFKDVFRKFDDLNLNDDHRS